MKLFYHPEADPPPGGPALTPSVGELRKLIEAAAEGSKSAQGKLDELLRAHGELKSKVEAIEAQLATKPAREAKPKGKSWMPWDSGDK